MRFSGLRLQNWRNFKAVDVPLQNRAFLVGPNASGKSNLLDVFRFLHDIVAVGGGFQQAVRARGGVTRLRCLSARRFPNIEIAVQIGDEQNPDQWEYELHFTQDNLRQPIIKKERVRHKGAILLDRPNIADKSDEERLTQTSLEQVNENREFRDVVEFFESVRYLHVVPQLIREPDRSVGKTNDPYGGDFLEEIAKTTKKTQDARLRRIRDALGVAVPQLKELEVWRDEGGIPHLRGRWDHWRPQGAWQYEEQFSDGTLRLLGLLWALLKGSGPLLLEEPELSLHPEVVRFIPQMFARVQRRAGRQILVSTHSSNLLEDEGIGLDEVLILRPGPDGTTLSTAGSIENVQELLAGGSTLADVILPRTRPEGASRLAGFGERNP